MNAPEFWGGPVGDPHVQWAGLRSLVMDPWKTCASNFTLANLRAAKEALERERRNPRPAMFFMSLSEYEARMSDPNSLYGRFLPPDLEELTQFHSRKLESIYEDASRLLRLKFREAGWVDPDAQRAEDDVRADAFEKMMELRPNQEMHDMTGWLESGWIG